MAGAGQAAAILGFRTVLANRGRLERNCSTGRTPATKSSQYSKGASASLTRIYAIDAEFARPLGTGTPAHAARAAVKMG